MKQRLNKVRAKANRTYKEQKYLAISRIARTCSLWLYSKEKETTNKGACLDGFYSPAFCLLQQNQDEKLLQQSAKSTHQNKPFNYNSKQNNKGE